MDQRFNPNFRIDKQKLFDELKKKLEVNSNKILSDEEIWERINKKFPNEIKIDYSVGVDSSNSEPKEYSYIEIQSEADFADLVQENGIIQGNIIFREGPIYSLGNLTKVIGNLGMSDSLISNLGKLSYVTGDFWISYHHRKPLLKSLHNLKRVDGNLNLRYSSVKSLGSLTDVGGNLDLRDTPIKSLDNLKNVNGQLLLPNRFRGSQEIESLSVIGKIKFWKSKPKYNDHTVPQDKLTTYHERIPKWENSDYIRSAIEINEQSESVRKFYEKFRDSFFRGIYIDLIGNYSYAFTLYYELIAEIETTEKVEEIEFYLETLSIYYPFIGPYESWRPVNKFESESQYELAWKERIRTNHYDIIQIFRYEVLLEKNLLNGHFIAQFGGTSHLTDFGQGHLEEVKNFATTSLISFEKEHENKFRDIFFKKHNGFCAEQLVNYCFAEEYYSQFYLKQDEFLMWVEVDKHQEFLRRRDLSKVPHVVLKAISTACRQILREAEDLFRVEQGLPKVGEGWINETNLYYLFKDHFPNEEVVHHGKPKWLGRQHLDIYFPILNIGVEYQGKQHSEPVEFFGGEEAFKSNIERDKRKKKLCLENDCVLIEVFPDYNSEDVLNEISQIIANRQRASS